MKIEKVLVKKTLKCGSNVYAIGEYSQPIPSDIVAEAHAGRGIVEILKTVPDPPPIIKVSPAAGTSTSEVGTVAGDGVVDQEKIKPKTQPPKPSKKPKLKPRAKKKAPAAKRKPKLKPKKVKAND